MDKAFYASLLTNLFQGLWIVYKEIRDRQAKKESDKSALSIAAQTLEEKREEAQAQRLDKYLDDIQRDADRLREIANQSLAQNLDQVNQIQTLKVELADEKIRVRMLAAENEELVAERDEERKEKELAIQKVVQLEQAIRSLEKR